MPSSRNSDDHGGDSDTLDPDLDSDWDRRFRDEQQQRREAEQQLDFAMLQAQKNTRYLEAIRELLRSTNTMVTEAMRANQEQTILLTKALERLREVRGSTVAQALRVLGGMTPARLRWVAVISAILAGAFAASLLAAAYSNWGAPSWWGSGLP